jgi:hypothetical protein
MPRDITVKLELLTEITAGGETWKGPTFSTMLKFLPPLAGELVEDIRARLLEGMTSWLRSLSLTERVAGTSLLTNEGEQRALPAPLDLLVSSIKKAP